MWSNFWQANWTRRQTGWAVFLLTAFAFALYARAPVNGFFNLDDGAYVEDNPLIRNFDLATVAATFRQFFYGLYLPLVQVSFMVDYQFWPSLITSLPPEDPFGYHLQNVLWFAATVPLLFLLVRRIAHHAAVACVTAALFAAHPVHVESVAWITERKDVMFGFFFFAALLAYSKYQQESRARWYGVSFFLFVASCFCKITAVILPVIMVLVDIAAGERLLRRKLWLEKLPFFLVSLIVGGATTFIGLRYAIRPDFDWAHRLTLGGEAMLFYLAKSFWPLRLAFQYPMPRSMWDLPWGEIIWALLVSGAIGVFLLKKGKGRLLILCIGFFVINLLPVIQIVPTGMHLAADRYLYVSSFGICWMVALALEGIAQTKPNRWSLRAGYVQCVGLAIIVGLSVLIVLRVEVWRDSLSIWEDVARKYPESEWSHYHLGRTYFGLAREKDAEDSFKRAAQLNPTYRDAHVALMVLYLNQERRTEAEQELELAQQSAFAQGPALYHAIAKSLRKDGQFEKAASYYEYVIKKTANNANALEAHEELGSIYLRLHRSQEASQHFQVILNRQPNSSSAWTNLGKARLQLRQHDKAIEAFQRALLYKPTNAAARAHLVELLVSQGNLAEAEKSLIEGLALDSAEANLHYLYGTLLLQRHEPSKAIPHLQLAVAILRHLPAAHANLGVAYIQTGDYNKSVASYQRGLQLAPQHAGLWANLALAHQSQKNFPAAQGAWEKAVQFDPQNESYKKQLDAVKGENNSTNRPQ